MTIRKKNKVDAKGSMLLLCATEAEVAFFLQLRKDCRYSNLTVKKASAPKLDKMLAEAGSLRNKEKYSSAWILFGFDEVEMQREDLPEYEEMAEKKRVRMLYFAPSFDLYFALFQGGLSKPATKEELQKKNAAAYEGFELSAAYFLTKGANINFKIYPKLAVADQNARSYNTVCEMESGYDATILPDFLEDLKEVCGKADMSHARNRF